MLPPTPARAVFELLLLVEALLELEVLEEELTWIFVTGVFEALWEFEFCTTGTEIFDDETVEVCTTGTGFSIATSGEIVEFAVIFPA